MPPPALAALSTQLPGTREAYSPLPAVPDPINPPLTTTITDSSTGSTPPVSPTPGPKRPRTRTATVTVTPLELDYDPTLNAKPCSPFYRHASIKQSIRNLGTQAKASRPPSLTDAEQGLVTGDNRGSQLWAQKRRHCDCLRGLSRRQRLATKVAIAIVTLGTMVAVALGISVAVGGGVWKSNHQHQDIPRAWDSIF